MHSLSVLMEFKQLSPNVGYYYQYYYCGAIVRPQLHCVPFLHLKLTCGLLFTFSNLFIALRRWMFGVRFFSRVCLQTRSFQLL